MKIKAFEVILSSLLHVSQQNVIISEKHSTSRVAHKSQTNTLGERISKLKEQDFFKKERTRMEVYDALAANGHIHEKDSIAMTLLRLVRSGELRRLKRGKNWIYVNP